MTKLKTFAHLLRAKQQVFRKRLMPHVAARTKIMRDNYPLLPAFVTRRVSYTAKCYAGGPNALIADLGLAYCIAVTKWFTDRRRSRIALSTWVWNQLLWAMPELRAERRLIASHSSEMQTEEYNALRRQSRRIVFFHGREGLCDDPALLAPVTVDSDYRLDIQAAMRFLKPREQKMVTRYYCDELTLRAIAQELRVTKERVRQICKRAICKLETALRRMGYVDRWDC